MSHDTTSQADRQPEPPPTTGELAGEYARRGWSLLRIARGAKAPLSPGWQKKRTLEEWQVKSLFGLSPVNIGVLLGESSGGLADIDLDHPEAVAMADEYLPPTNAIFGRTSKPRSHRLFRVVGDIATHKRQDSRRGDESAGMIVELRSTGTQTVFPGSVHPSGELIEWDTFGEPAEITADDLMAAVDRLADAVDEKLGIDSRKKTAPNKSAKNSATTKGILARARKYVDKMPSAIAGIGGHNATYNVACELFRFGLSDSDASRLFDEYNQRCEPPWTDTELAHKLRDARQEVEAAGEFGIRLERDSAADHIGNFEIVEDGEKTKPVPLLLTSIISIIRTHTDTWPRRVGTALFIDDAEHGIAWLQQPAELFGWLGGKKRVEWRGGVGYVKQGELFAELRRTSTTYVSVEELPHCPPMAGHYYRCGEIAPGDGAALAGLLDRFEPATPIDRDLLLATIVTPLWGGPAGARPASVITSDDGRGVGKSTVAKIISRMWGGELSFSATDDINKMRTRLLSSDALTRRVAILDNVKSHRFSWGDWEGLLTASTIGGHRMYVGEASRPNTLTWIITLNGAALSTDIAQRCVIIKIKRPRSSGTWEEDALAYVDQHREAILADCVGFFWREKRELEKFTRWGTWEKDVLQRLSDPPEAQRVIIERQKVADVEADESEIVEEFFGVRLSELMYTPETQRVHIPSAIAAGWFGLATNERISTVAAGRRLGQMIDEGRLPRLDRNSCNAWGRGVVWVGTGSDAADTVRSDLEERISDHRKKIEQEKNKWS